MSKKEVLVDENLLKPKDETIKVIQPRLPNLEDKKRHVWSNHFEFVLSLIGYAVSLGNIWRFPYLCYRNGGGAFLIPYWLMLFVCGIPLFFLEVALGQFSSKGAIHVWNFCPLFKGVGIGTVLLTMIGSTSFNLLLAIILFYLIAAFERPLPWGQCNNEWNTLECFVFKAKLNNSFISTNLFASPRQIKSHNDSSTIYDNISTMSMIKSSTLNTLLSSNYINNDNYISGYTSNLTNFFLNSYNETTVLQHNLTYKFDEISTSSAYEFWSHRVIQITSGLHEMGSFNVRLLGCFVLAWILTYFCLMRGIKTTGKIVYVTATLPYIILTALLIRTVFLPGAWEGILFFLKPDWSKLKHVKIWNEAATQIFYSLGPGWGGLITMASYNKFRDNCLRDSVTVSVVSCFTSVYAGLVVFSLVGFMSHILSLPIEKVATHGVGLAFIVYPEALLHMPWSNFWAILFFSMLLAVGIDTIFVQLEVVYTAMYEALPRRYRHHRYLFSFFASIIMFLLGLPYLLRGGILLFQLFDWYMAILSVMIFCLFETISISWIYGAHKFIEDVEFMMNRKVVFARLWIFLWKYVIPILLIIALLFNIIFHAPVQYGDYTYPEWATSVGWLISCLSLIPIPAYAIYHIWFSGKMGDSYLKKICNSLKPSHNWHPILEPYKSQYQNYHE